MKNATLGIVVLLAGMLAMSSVQAQEQVKETPVKAAGAVTIKLQTTCPVMGEAIDRSLYVDYEGKRIYVCCLGCIEAVKKDPAMYIKKLEDEGVTVAKLQTTCPVMGGKIDKSLYVDFEGKRIYICCPGCIAAIKKDPAKYISQLESEGVVLDPAGALDKAVEPEK